MVLPQSRRAEKDAQERHQRPADEVAGDLGHVGRGDIENEYIEGQPRQKRGDTLAHAPTEHTAEGRGARAGGEDLKRPRRVGHVAYASKLRPDLGEGMFALLDLTGELIYCHHAGEPGVPDTAGLDLGKVAVARLPGGEDGVGQDIKFLVVLVHAVVAGDTAHGLHDPEYLRAALQKYVPGLQRRLKDLVGGIFHSLTPGKMSNPENYQRKNSIFRPKLQ